MDQFKDYSGYYDKIYKDKDYQKEIDFILKVLKKFSFTQGKKLLSLGCGTCTYELLMAKKGFSITGIDRSQEMLDEGIKKINESGLQSKIRVLRKDVRHFSFKEKFDNSMAMFNIAGYQTDNKDFELMLKNVSKCLKKGGVFLFDCWYMPAVLKDNPTDRIKKIKTKDGNLIRLTKSGLNIMSNVIKINFGVIETKKDKIIGETNETHSMRYWSLPELQYFMSKAGFSIIKTCNFMDLNSVVSDNKWDIFVVARKDK